MKTKINGLQTNCTYSYPLLLELVSLYKVCFFVHFMLLVSLYTPKNRKLWFTDVFRGYRKRSVA